MPDILPLLLRLQPVLTKTTCRQLYRIVMAILVMPKHITQRSIARWADKGGSYRTIHRFFQTNIDWMQVQWLLFLLVLHTTTDTYLLVGDETVLKKAGKHTFGLDRFFVTTQRLDRLPILGKIPAKTMTNQEARALYRQGEVVAV